MTHPHHETHWSMTSNQAQLAALDIEDELGIDVIASRDQVIYAPFTHVFLY